MYYIYIVRCSDDSFYTGICTDPVRRMQAHCGLRSGGAKYTRSRPISRVEAIWCTRTRADASRLEYRIKALTRTQKQQLIRSSSLPEVFREEALDPAGYTFCPLSDFPALWDLFPDMKKDLSEL